MYPQIEIDLKKIGENAKVMLHQCKAHGVVPCAVTKVVCADKKVATELVENGFKQLADSRIENIIKLREYFGQKIETLLLRLPMLSDCEKVVQYCDISLNSELATLKELDKHAKRQKKTHKVIIMVDLGDLREGIWPNEVLTLKDELKKLNNIEVLGLGTNLTCYGGVIPTNETLSKLIELKEKWEVDKDKLHLISGGNSSSINIMTSKDMPQEVNHLRLGESLFLGRETVARKHIVDTNLDAFKVKAEIIEVKKKPSIPIGTIGQDAFGETPTFEDKGEHLRAIAAIGRQDIALSMEPLQKGVEIIGGSSDHLLLDVDEKTNLKVGDIVEFIPGYGALLAAMTSPYVRKVYK
ncbi:alanine/ornithine racemase family PLP-dependent enzyme [Proteinivorax tanatarense]|uniref:Alanine/ornithine racemase family PLP-dependent enzyme n=1 Tax=Proteinivorax tanatarense TaxID=1260629 RepID=A0AAU7VMJ5_9FIRM